MDPRLKHKSRGGFLSESEASMGSFRVSKKLASLARVHICTGDGNSGYPLSPFGCRQSHVIVPEVGPA